MNNYFVAKSKSLLQRLRPLSEMTIADKQQLPSRNWNATHLVQVKLHQYVVIPIRSSTVFLHTVSYCSGVFTEQYSRPFNKRTLNRLSFFIQCKAYSAKQEK